MTQNVNQVRSKPFEPKRRSLKRVWLALCSFLIVAAGGTLAFLVYSGEFGLFTPPIEIVANGAGRTIRVPPGGSVQAAVDRAESGDIVELQAGATYFGEIKLPNKPLTDFVTIRSSAADNLPADKRVGPANAASMAKIIARGPNSSAVSAENGAHQYRFVGIEFTATGSDYVYNLILLGNGEPAAKIPHDLEIDRSYLHPGPKGVIRRGIALNSGATTVKNSYIEGFGFPGEETQGICGWTGTRNVKILNNYIEGGAENIMFGGSDIASMDLIPTDIEVKNNHLKKPNEWKGKASMKTLFELKNAKHVQFVENYIENNLVGVAFRITVRNETGGSPYNTIEDVLIKDNVINGAGDGINILGSDNLYPSQTLKRLTITNNLMLNIGGPQWEGSGYFIQITDGEDILIANNTSINKGNIATIYGKLPRNCIVRDNIVGHGDYGIHGLDDIRSPFARSMFQNNLFINLNRVPPNEYVFPAGNIIVPGIADVGFVDPNRNDYRLSPSSKYRGKGRGGKDFGADLPPQRVSTSNLNE